MGEIQTCLRLLGAAALALTALVQITHATELPQATRDMLRAEALDPSLLDGLDRELAVPAAWIEAARSEDPLKIRLGLTEQQFNLLAGPFTERYPYIRIEYTRGLGVERALNPLSAFKRRKYVADVITGFTIRLWEFRDRDALERIDDLPAWNKVPQQLRGSDGTFAAFEVENWCTSYNVEKVNASELPATWTDLVDAPRWRDGKAATANRPQFWLISLWGANGQTWGEDYLEQFFGTLKPQLRTETTDGMMQLVASGEVDIAVPSSGVNVRKQAHNGAPIAFHCPEPVPTRWSEVGMFRGTPRTHSAKIFINWLLSKEGQIALYHATGARPSHVELTDLESLQPYPEALRGKTMALTTPAMIENDMKPMFDTWVGAWVDAGGPRGDMRRKVEPDDD